MLNGIEQNLFTYHRSFAVNGCRTCQNMYIRWYNGIKYIVQLMQNNDKIIILHTSISVFLDSKVKGKILWNNGSNPTLIFICS
jgi:hypothetical protein